MINPLLVTAGILGVVQPAPVPDPHFADVIFLANFADIADTVLDVDRHKFTPQVGASTCQPSAANASSRVESGELIHDISGDFDFLEPGDEPLLDIGTNSFCAEGWFKEDTSARANFRAYFKQYEGSPEKSWIVQPDGSVVKMSVSANGSTSSYTTVGSDGYPVSNTYTHLAMIKSGSAIGWYVNGVRTYNRTYSSLNATLEPFATQAQGRWKSVRYTARNARYGSPSSMSSFTPDGEAGDDYRFATT